MFGRRKPTQDPTLTIIAGTSQALAQAQAAWVPGPVPRPASTAHTAPWADAWLTADDARAWRER
jgi:hypothetical protein